MNTGIVWFRQDLRLHDNEALTEAINHADEIYCVYVFDDRFFGKITKNGFRKMGPHRTQFYIESVKDLSEQLKKKGISLIIRRGKAEKEVLQLATELKSSFVYCNRERTQEEITIQDKLEKNLWSLGQEIKFVRGKMLYHTLDLPFPVAQTPDVFTAFRKEVEKFVPIRKPLDVPIDFKPGNQVVESMEIPKLEDFGYSKKLLESNRFFKGGEISGLNRLKYYLWDSNLINQYKETRNDLLGDDFSSKFSPWLAAGCLSPKTIYHEIKKYEAENGDNESTYWLFFELLWRDYFRLISKKYGNKIFQYGGIQGGNNIPSPNTIDRSKLDAWINGQTGVPFIDANMRELAQTGYMSNRGRQNVASFLINDLKLNWQLGAEYFEEQLIDYDVCSNWGNWNYLAGVGTDPRENRYFNVLTQAKRYDPSGDYVRHWVNELANLKGENIFMPHNLKAKELSSAKVELGTNYPFPIVKTAKW